ncbi:ribonuclease H-like domain-containing protein [Tanacetum coccineum]
MCRSGNMSNELCAKKGIKREFSVARTPQQNGVAERKNRTLIKAARTMLADSLLPIPFWTEAVNTDCYVLNRVLVTKPQNKTPYELLIGKDKGPTQEYILLPLHPHRTRIPVEDVAPAAHEKPSESSPKDNDVQDSEDVADKEGQHQMQYRWQSIQISYDVLYDQLVQFKLHVLASRAKKAAKNHDPLALIAHSNACSSHSHTNSSYSPQPYYVIHPSSVVNYDDEYQGELQGDFQEDKLTTAMMLCRSLSTGSQ